MFCSTVLHDPFFNYLHIIIVYFYFIFFFMESLKLSRCSDNAEFRTKPGRQSTNLMIDARYYNIYIKLQV